MKQRKNVLIFGLCVLLVSASAFTHPVGIQDTQQDVRVRLRLLPVTVTDRDGKAVKGLTKDDFELLVDGKSVAIRNVDENDYSELRQAVRSGRPIKRTWADMPARRIVLVFDLLSCAIKGDPQNSRYQNENPGALFPTRGAAAQGVNSTDGRDRARGIFMSKNAAKRWLDKELLPTDEVAIVSYYLSPELIQPFTKNKKSLERAVNSITLPMGFLPQQMSIDTEFADLEEQGEESTPMDTGSEARSLTRSYLGFFERLGRLMTGLPGTKQVILFSEGLVINRVGENLNMLPEMRQTTDALSSSNSRVNTIGISDLMTSSVVSDETEFLFTMANETGGEFKRTRARVDGSLREIADSFEHFYEVFFSPNPDEDAGFHRVEVRVKREGVSVKAPSGYLGEREYDQLSGTEREVHLQKGFWQPLVENELNATMNMAVLPLGEGKALLHLRSLVPVDDEREDTHSEFELFLTVGKEGELYEKVQWLGKREKLSENLQLDVMLTIPAGHSSFQFAIRDKKSGHRAYMLKGIEVPDRLPKMVISPIYFVDPGSENVASVVVQQRGKSKRLTSKTPPEIETLIKTSQAIKITAGKALNGHFLFKGPNFEHLILAMKQGDLKENVLAQSFKQTRLSDGLRLISFSFNVPKWPAGEVDMNIIYQERKKLFGLTSAKLTIEK